MRRQPATCFCLKHSSRAANHGYGLPLYLGSEGSVRLLHFKHGIFPIITDKDPGAVGNCKATATANLLVWGS